MLTYLTSSSLRHPLPIKASLGCRYLWKVFLMTESLLTLMPTCSSIALMFVFYLVSPPSVIMITHRPPSSMYLLMSYSSCALNGRRGPPKSNMWHSFNLFNVNSVLFISHLYRYFSFYTIFLKPWFGFSISFFDVSKRIYKLSIVNILYSCKFKILKFINLCKINHQRIFV